MICNESGGKNPKDEKWIDIIQGMRIYSPEQIRESLESVGFENTEIDIDKKGWICAVCKKV